MLVRVVDVALGSHLGDGALLKRVIQRGRRQHRPWSQILPLANDSAMAVLRGVVGLRRQVNSAARGMTPLMMSCCGFQTFGTLTEVRSRMYSPKGLPCLRDANTNLV